MSSHSRGHFPRWAPILTAALAITIVLLAYHPSLKGPFLFSDDETYIVNNVLLQRIPLSECWRLFATRTNPWEYLPVRDLSYRIDMALFGLHPAGFRLHNLFLYAMGCLAAWYAVWSILECLPETRCRQDDRLATRNRWMATAVTALFAAHPAHVESVAWISGRKDLLSGLFALLSLAFLARSLAERPHAGRYEVVTCLFFFLAILSKSTVVTLPLVGALLSWMAEDRATAWTSRAVRTLRRVAPILLLSVASVMVQVWGSSTLDRSAIPGTGITDVFARATQGARILGALSESAIIPIRLGLIHDIDRSGGVYLCVGLLGLGLLTLVTWKALRQPSLFCFGVSASGLLALPFLQWIPFKTWSYASERFLFLPVLGIGLGIVAAIQSWPRARRALLIALLFFSGVFLTLSRSREWVSEKELLTRNLRLAPSNPVLIRQCVQSVLLPERRFADARALVASGTFRQNQTSQRVFLQQYIEARQALYEGRLESLEQTATWLWGAAPQEDYPIRLDIANLLLEARLFDKAAGAYRELLQDSPYAVPLHYNLGLALSKQGQYLEAIDQIQMAIDGGLANATIWNSLALACQNAGKVVQAEEAYWHALAVDPRYWHAAYNLARLRLSQGNVTGAVEAITIARNRAMEAGDPIDAILELERSVRR